MLHGTEPGTAEGSERAVFRAVLARHGARHGFDTERRRVPCRVRTLFCAKIGLFYHFPTTFLVSSIAALRKALANNTRLDASASRMRCVQGGNKPDGCLIPRHRETRGTADRSMRNCDFERACSSRSPLPPAPPFLVSILHASSAATFAFLLVTFSLAVVACAGHHVTPFLVPTIIVLLEVLVKNGRICSLFFIRAFVLHSNPQS